MKKSTNQFFAFCIVLLGFCSEIKGQELGTWFSTNVDYKLSTNLVTTQEFHIRWEDGSIYQKLWRPSLYLLKNKKKQFGLGITHLSNIRRTSTEVNYRPAINYWFDYYINLFPESVGLNIRLRTEFNHRTNNNLDYLLTKERDFNLNYRAKLTYSKKINDKYSSVVFNEIWINQNVNSSHTELFRNWAGIGLRRKISDQLKVGLDIMLQSHKDNSTIFASLMIKYKI